VNHGVRGAGLSRHRHRGGGRANTSPTPYSSPTARAIPAALPYIHKTVTGAPARVSRSSASASATRCCPRALGGTTFKLKFGHRGGNQPVKNLETGKVSITAQNHGFATDPKSLEKRGAKVTEINLNDNTVEGLRHTRLPIFSVQYHPEAAPGPNDADPLFVDFYRMVEARKAGRI
jgi:carbamoyl-phosphate synthase small subunit